MTTFDEALESAARVLIKAETAPAEGARELVSVASCWMALADRVGKGDKPSQ